jgi:hypothetical protein
VPISWQVSINCILTKKFRIKIYKPKRVQDFRILTKLNSVQFSVHVYEFGSHFFTAFNHQTTHFNVAVLGKPLAKIECYKNVSLLCNNNCL